MVHLSLMHIATKSEKITLVSEKKTSELAKKVQKKIVIGDIIFMSGEIGVGKTTFVKYLINQFQKENNMKITEITSPTFNLLNEYKINDFSICHYDLFRIKDSSELKNLNIFENSSNSITLIEWPQIIKEKPKKFIEFFFQYEDDYKKRSVQIKGLNF